MATMSLEQQAAYASQLLRDGKWDELNTFFASSPKSTDTQAQDILSAQDTEQAEALLATWKRQVQSEAINRSNFGSLVK